MKATTKSFGLWALTAALVLMLAGIPSPAEAAKSYGEAVVEKGRITLMRNGKTTRYRKSATPIAIEEGDLIRVRGNSQLLLKSREKATMTLGSNAVFHVKAWQAKEKSGFARMLFGRVRANISGLTGGERFNVKTATATIGVKGTGYRSAVNPRGDTMLITTENVVQFGGPDGLDQDVGLNYLSVVVNGRASTSPVLTPPAVNAAFGDDNLDAPPANSDEGRGLPAQEALISLGIVSQDDASEGQQDDGGQGDDDSGIDSVEVETDVDNALDNINRAHVRIGWY